MNDKEYFSHYKDSFEAIFSSNTEDCAFIKDIDFKYQAVTEKKIKLLGVNSNQDMLGRNFF